MIAGLIRWSVANRFLVVLTTLALAAAGAIAVATTPVDALPDLSDVQVVIRTSYPGQAPQIVENQVTYPLTTTMLSVPGARTVRGYSFFGDSFVYIIFNEGTDLYWARSRVLEYLNQVQGRLPPTAHSSLGPDATGVGWVYQYALIDRTGHHDLGQLRSLQDWLLRFELKTVPGVAEVASIGGMVRQYQIVLDPERMAAYGVSQSRVAAAVQRANQEGGGGSVEMGEAEHMVRASGYLHTLADFNAIPLGLGANGAPVTLGDVAWMQVGPEMRRGIAELNGEGEVAGGVVIIRAGANAREVIGAVQTRLNELRRNLPPGVEVVTTYDRSQLIDRSIENLTHKLAEEFIVVALVCALFLFHLRSALVAIITLPLGVAIAFLIMRGQGVEANIMSLSGIAIAVGAMVDAAIVMVENAHKKLERWREEHGETPRGDEHWRIVTEAAVEVGPALFFSLLIIALSFLPVFTLQAQEGRLFAPLAFTKTYAMAASAGLAVTLIPVLMGFWITGRIPSEHANPINRFLAGLYEPGINFTLAKPRLVLLIAALFLATTAWPLSRLGAEFMPMMDEGDLLYMPTALPGLSAAEASDLLQVTDRLIRTVPEVESVFGKAGRAETATDPAPLEMFETTIRLKPRSLWRPGMTPERIIDELDRTVRVPGLTNVWVPPIRNRIDMLATGVKSPIGVKVSGPDLASIDASAHATESAARSVRGVSSAIAERLSGGRYIDVDIDRFAASRYGLNIANVQDVVSGAIGGENIGEVVDGRARYPINLRYPREVRDTLERLTALPIVTDSGLRLTLGEVAHVTIADGPSMIRSENGRLSAFVYVDVRGRDLASVVGDLQHAIAAQVRVPPGVSITYSGQFEYLERATQRLMIAGPATLIVIFVLLYLTFRRLDEALLVMASLPFALIGGIWLVYLLGYDFSVAVGVGLIALAGLAAEFGVVMLLYLRNALKEREARGELITPESVAAAVRDGALLRLRPIAMTVAVIIAGLLPILWTGGTGAEIMRRIAAPMVGGMFTAPLLSLFVFPAAYFLIRRRDAERHALAASDMRIGKEVGEPI